MEEKRNFTDNQQEKNWPGMRCNSAPLTEELFYSKSFWLEVIIITMTFLF